MACAEHRGKHRPKQLRVPPDDEHTTKSSRLAASDLPAESLLQSYREAGAYTDCYWIEITAAVAQADYVEAFYTTWVFRLERRLLAWFIARPSTDAQARALGRGGRDTFVPCWGFTAFTHACCCALRFRV